MPGDDSRRRYQLMVKQQAGAPMASQPVSTTRVRG